LFHNEIIIGNTNPVEKTKLIRGILEIIDRALGAVKDNSSSYEDVLIKHL